MTMRQRGFTLIELLVVLAIIATLLSLAAPRYTGSVDKARESVLKENLTTLREAIDKHYGDTGKYPATLEGLVTKRYLRRIPVDPITDSTTSWVVLPPADPQKGAVFDVKSGAPGKSRDGAAYSSW
ncbi:MAG: prepilin-type N-terminal cleavage/methylation domain-containing protein [Gallionella sp.]|nr:MAG: prepilin-type N-terminal cleavage/methylation domain-containing protein [Gallionella sp.]